MEKYNKIWRIFFAVSLAAISVQQIIWGGFRPVILPPWHLWVCDSIICVWAGSILLILTSAAIVFKIRARPVAVCLGIVFLLLFFALHVPYQVKTDLSHIGEWTNAFKLLAFGGGAFLVAASLTKTTLPDNNTYPKIRWLGPAGRFLFSTTMIIFGIDHFLYPDFVASLVPSWMPWHLFWTYFAGSALIAAGLGMIFRIQRRLAATLLGAMILLWFFILHIPRAIADPYSGNGNEWTSVFEALGFSGIAFLIVGTIKTRVKS